MQEDVDADLDGDAVLLSTYRWYHTIIPSSPSIQASTWFLISARTWEHHYKASRSYSHSHRVNSYTGNIYKCRMLICSNMET